MTLRLGLPSKGRLKQQAAEWFAAHGLAVASRGAERDYALSLDGIGGIDLVPMSAAEIPGALAQGRLHLGLTGRDLVRETVPAWQTAVLELACPGFGHADLVGAVPEFWIDLVEIEDLDAIAAAFRARHGFRMRIATKYRNLVREFLTRHGIADYQIVESLGATEASVQNRAAELVADITSSGETLRANHLKVPEGGLILRSEAVLFMARAASWTETARAGLSGLAATLGLDDPRFQ
jgi:ATP phosphoribosyltransferase